MGNKRFGFVAACGYATMPAADVITSLSGIGYDAVEWTLAHFRPDGTGADAPARLVEQTRSAGLDVSRIMAHMDLVSLDDAQHNAAVEATVQVIEAAGACGVGNVGTMTGPAPWDPNAPKIPGQISEGAAWDQVIHAYTRFADAAARAGVIVSSEGVFGMVAHDFYSHKFLIDQIDSPWVTVNFDPSHGVLSGNSDVGWAIRQWGSRISHCHLKDAVGISQRPGEFLFPLLGEGVIDWASFSTALDDIEFAGVCSVEFESFAFLRNVLGNDIERAARLSWEAIQALLV